MRNTEKIEKMRKNRKKIREKSRKQSGENIREKSGKNSETEKYILLILQLKNEIFRKFWKIRKIRNPDLKTRAKNREHVLSWNTGDSCFKNWDSLLNWILFKMTSNILNISVFSKIVFRPFFTARLSIKIFRKWSNDIANFWIFYF